MRRITALLVAVLMIASSVEAGTLACMGNAPGVTSHHTCCPDGAPTAAPSPAACCAVAQVAAQQGPAEARVDAPALQVVSVDARAVQRPTQRPLYPDGTPPALSAVPLYLQQLSLLI